MTSESSAISTAAATAAADVPSALAEGQQELSDGEVDAQVEVLDQPKPTPNFKASDFPILVSPRSPGDVLSSLPGNHNGQAGNNTGSGPATPIGVASISHWANFAQQKPASSATAAVKKTANGVALKNLRPTSAAASLTSSSSTMASSATAAVTSGGNIIVLQRYSSDMDEARLKQAVGHLKERFHGRLQVNVSKNSQAFTIHYTLRGSAGSTTKQPSPLKPANNRYKSGGGGGGATSNKDENSSVASDQQQQQQADEHALIRRYLESATGLQITRDFALKTQEEREWSRRKKLLNELRSDLRVQVGCEEDGLVLSGDQVGVELAVQHIQAFFDLQVSFILLMV